MALISDEFQPVRAVQWRRFPNRSGWLRDTCYTFEEAMRMLNTTEDRLKLLVTEGVIRPLRRGEETFFLRRQVDALIAKRE